MVHIQVELRAGARTHVRVRRSEYGSSSARLFLVDDAHPSYPCVSGMLFGLLKWRTAVPVTSTTSVARHVLRIIAKSIPTTRYAIVSAITGNALIVTLARNFTPCLGLLPLPSRRSSKMFIVVPKQTTGSSSDRTRLPTSGSPIRVLHIHSARRPVELRRPLVVLQQGHYVKIPTPRLLGERVNYPACGHGTSLDSRAEFFELNSKCRALSSPAKHSSPSYRNVVDIAHHS